MKSIYYQIYKKKAVDTYFYSHISLFIFAVCLTYTYAKIRTFDSHLNKGEHLFFQKKKDISSSAFQSISNP